MAQVARGPADVRGMKRIALAVLNASLIVPLVIIGLASPALADVRVVSLPTAVAVDSTFVHFTGTVQVSASATGLRSASLWFRYPDGTAARTLVGSATSRKRDVLTVTGRLDARRITPGLNQVRVLDDVDGDGQTIVLDLRRRSRLAITRADFLANGQVVLSVQTRHYDPKTGRYVASRFSPVRLQEKVGKRWVAVGSLTTDRAGAGVALVSAGPGPHVYRARRPDGATVMAATSKQFSAARP